MVAVRSFNHALCDGFKVLLTPVLRDFRLGFKFINDAAAIACGAAAAPELVPVFALHRTLSPIWGPILFIYFIYFSRKAGFRRPKTLHKPQH